MAFGMVLRGIRQGSSGIYGVFHLFFSRGKTYKKLGEIGNNP
jgi:hypothetical protein